MQKVKSALLAVIPAAVLLAGCSDLLKSHPSPVPAEVFYDRRRRSRHRGR